MSSLSEHVHGAAHEFQPQRGDLMSNRLHPSELFRIACANRHRKNRATKRSRNRAARCEKLECRELFTAGLGSIVQEFNSNIDQFQSQYAEIAQSKMNIDLPLILDNVRDVLDLSTKLSSGLQGRIQNVTNMTAEALSTQLANMGFDVQYVGTVPDQLGDLLRVHRQIHWAPTSGSLNVGGAAGFSYFQDGVDGELEGTLVGVVPEMGFELTLGIDLLDGSPSFYIASGSNLNFAIGIDGNAHGNLGIKSLLDVDVQGRIQSSISGGIRLTDTDGKIRLQELSTRSSHYLGGQISLSDAHFSAKLPVLGSIQWSGSWNANYVNDHWSYATPTIQTPSAESLLANIANGLLTAKNDFPFLGGVADKLAEKFPVIDVSIGDVLGVNQQLGWLLQSTQGGQGSIRSRLSSLGIEVNIPENATAAAQMMHDLVAGERVDLISFAVEGSSEWGTTETIPLAKIPAGIGTIDVSANVGAGFAFTYSVGMGVDTMGIYLDQNTHVGIHGKAHFGFTGEFKLAGLLNIGSIYGGAKAQAGIDIGLYDPDPSDGKVYLDEIFDGNNLLDSFMAALDVNANADLYGYVGAELKLLIIRKTLFHEEFHVGQLWSSGQEHTLVTTHRKRPAVGEATIALPRTADGAVIIEGGDGDDRITLSKEGGLVKVVWLGHGQALLEDVTAVRFNGRGGNDRLQASEDFDIRIEANGGEGDDVLIGGAADDQLDGGTGDDRLDGRGGNDTLNGNEGDDRLLGGQGFDRLYGGSGDDWLDGGIGNDVLYGGSGDDYLIGGNGDDRLFGEQGEDLLRGGNGDDYLEGGEDDDFIFGEAGNDSLHGNEGDDVLSGDDGNDVIQGNEGDDFLQGGEGDDSLYGGNGNDSLVGGGGNDHLAGGEGDDRLNGGAGDDEVFGDAGNDRIEIDFDGGIGSKDAIFGGTGEDNIMITGQVSAPTVDEHGVVMINDSFDDVLELNQLDATSFVAYSLSASGELLGSISFTLLPGSDSDIEGIGVDGLGGDDVIRAKVLEPIQGGFARPVNLFGGDGNDHLVGSFGNDYLDGGAGDDLLEGAAGNDEIRGGDGNDVIYGGSGEDRLYGQAGDDVIYGGSGRDVSFGGSGNDEIFAGTDLIGDIIYGEEGNDTLRGGEGVDVIQGGDGDDHIYGGGMLDVLWGGAGNDYIYGEGGIDVINGGAGDDWLYASDGCGNDLPTLTDLRNMYQQAAELLHSAGLQLDQFSDSTYSSTESTNEKITAANQFAIAGQLNLLISQSLGGNLVAEILDGAEGDDRLFGSPAPDVYVGGSGNDILMASGGHDSVVGGDGDDVLMYRGTNNADRIEFRAETDNISGGSYATIYINNSLRGNLTDVDVESIGVDAAGGDDTITADFGNLAVANLYILAGEGNDYVDLRTIQSNAFVDGQEGNDTLIGGLGNDKLLGGSDDDEIFGNEGDDSLWGGEGNDRIFADSGNDVILGNEGNDTLSGGNDSDRIEGGAGDDQIHGDAGDESGDGIAGADQIWVEFGLYGGAGNDTLIAGQGRDNLFGGEGSDWLIGGVGFEESGAEIPLGGQEQDQLFGGPGVDLLFGQTDGDVIDGGDGVDWIAGDNRGDDIHAVSTQDNIAKQYLLSGDSLVLLSSDGELVKIDTRTLALTNIWEKATTSFVQSPSQKIYARAVDGELRVFDIDSGASEGIWSKAVDSYAVASDGRLYALSTDGDLRVFPNGTGSGDRSVWSKSVKKFELTSDGRLYALARDGEFRGLGHGDGLDDFGMWSRTVTDFKIGKNDWIYALSSNSELQWFPWGNGHADRSMWNKPVKSFEIAADGRLYALAQDGELRLFNDGTNLISQGITSARIKQFAIDPRSTWLWTLSVDGQMDVCPAGNGEGGRRLWNGSIDRFVISTDGRLYAQAESVVFRVLNGLSNAERVTLAPATSFELDTLGLKIRLLDSEQLVAPF